MEKELGRCDYCGCKVPWYAHICGSCYQKLILVRKLRGIVYAIKRQAEEESRKNKGGKSP